MKSQKAVERTKEYFKMFDDTRTEKLLDELSRIIKMYRDGLIMHREMENKVVVIANSFVKKVCEERK